MSQPTIWLFSAYHTDSHAHWTGWLQGAFPQFRWKLFSLPGRHFRWRIRGNPLSWLDQLPDAETPDLLIVTSMVDLATLKGLHPALARVPVLCYFHENQFTYPKSSHQHPSIDPQMVQLYSALAADRIAFNSAFNRDTFIEGVNQLVRQLPDHVPTDLASRLLTKSEVLPVPVTPIHPASKDERLILWNHRWEYDKAPEVFAGALQKLLDDGISFRLALLGARHREPHAALTEIREQLPSAWILADGFLAPGDYADILSKSSIVVSSAIHEFQGISMLQAVSAGATPLAPNALCYAQQYPTSCLYPAGDVGALAQTLKDWLLNGIPAVPDVSEYLSGQLLPRWKDCLHGLID